MTSPLTPASHHHIQSTYIDFHESSIHLNTSTGSAGLTSIMESKLCLQDTRDLPSDPTGHDAVAHLSPGPESRSKRNSEPRRERHANERAQKGIHGNFRSLSEGHPWSSGRSLICKIQRLSIIVRFDESIHAMGSLNYHHLRLFQAVARAGDQRPAQR